MEDIDLNETNLLLDESIDEKKVKVKTAFSRLNQMKDELDASQATQCCLSSYVQDKFYGLRVDSVSSSSYIFQIRYCGKNSHESNCFSGNTLVWRIKKLFYEEPLSLFEFYFEVLLSYSSPVLRKYLIKKRIKFNSQEIIEFQ